MGLKVSGPSILLRRDIDIIADDCQSNEKPPNRTTTNRFWPVGPQPEVDYQTAL